MVQYYNMMIHVHTQTDQSTIEYVKFMWATMLTLSNQPSLLKLTVHCFDERSIEAVTNAKLPNATAVMVRRPTWLNNAGTMSGSSGHAACVEAACQMMIDDDIHIIADSDTVVLLPGWDDNVRNTLTNVGIVGTTYENIGGFSSGTGKSQTYKNIPNVVWCAMRPGYPWDQLQVQPYKDRDVYITDAKLSKIYNLPVGYTVLRDVAWQIPEFLDKHNVQYLGLKQLKPTKDAVVLKGITDYHEEYHTEDGVPFVVHQRGSLRHAYRQAKISKQFYDAVDSYLLTQRKTAG